MRKVGAKPGETPAAKWQLDDSFSETSIMSPPNLGVPELAWGGGKVEESVECGGVKKIKEAIAWEGMNKTSTRTLDKASPHGSDFQILLCRHKRTNIEQSR